MPNLKNLTFAQIDRDSSGAIELEEFRNVRTGDDVETSADSGMETAVRRPEPENTDFATAMAPDVTDRRLRSEAGRTGCCVLKR